jgi:lysophospholipase L1-like esterase
VNAVMLLQKERPGIPVLLTDHAGYTNEGTNAVRQKEYQDGNTALQEVFDSLVNKGVKGIYRLTKEEIGQDIETMVDGVHPNDMGMMRYADAYEKKIRIILNEPKGNISTTIPISQRRDAKYYDWETRHNEILAFNQDHSPGLVFIGNSITHYWGGLPASTRAGGPDSWKKYFDPLNAENLGYGWDRIENVLWRIYHGELDHIHPRQIVMMIGTNNLQLNTDPEIIEGLKFLMKAIREKQPDAQILLLGLLPRRDMEKRVSSLNAQIAVLKWNAKVRYADAGSLFLKNDNKINESLFSDGLHPNAEGYERFGKFIISNMNH